jgi:hypothetical protein
VRTVEHVEWSAVYVRRDLDRKIRHIQSVQANEREAAQSDVQTGIEARIINICQKSGGEKESVVINNCIKRKGVDRDSVLELLGDMVQRGALTTHAEKSRNGVACIRYESMV